MALVLSAAAILFFDSPIQAGQTKPAGSSYKVLPPVTQDNLRYFPIVTDSTANTHNFLTLDEGLRSGQVVITEEGASPDWYARARHARRPPVRGRSVLCRAAGSGAMT